MKMKCAIILTLLFTISTTLTKANEKVNVRHGNLHNAKRRIPWYPQDPYDNPEIVYSDCPCIADNVEYVIIAEPLQPDSSSSSTVSLTSNESGVSSYGPSTSTAAASDGHTSTAASAIVSTDSSTRVVDRRHANAHGGRHGHIGTHARHGQSTNGRHGHVGTHTRHGKSPNGRHGHSSNGRHGHSSHQRHGHSGHARHAQAGSARHGHAHHE